MGYSKEIIQDVVEGEPLAPHAPSTKINYMYANPTIYVKEQVLDDLYYIIGLVRDIEVSWLGTVVPYEDGDYLIDQVFVTEQSCGIATTALSPEGLAELDGQLDDDHRQRLQYWGHLHPGNSTAPSGQDNDQLRDYLEQSRFPWFIRSISNKRGRLEFTLVFYDSGLEIIDVPWRVGPKPTIQQNQDKAAEWKAQLSQKVKKEAYTNYGTSGKFGNTLYDIGYNAFDRQAWEVPRESQLTKDKKPIGRMTDIEFLEAEIGGLNAITHSAT